MKLRQVVAVLMGLVGSVFALAAQEQVQAKDVFGKPLLGHLGKSDAEMRNLSDRKIEVAEMPGDDDE